MTHTQTGSK